MKSGFYLPPYIFLAVCLVMPAGPPLLAQNQAPDQARPAPDSSRTRLSNPYRLCAGDVIEIKYFFNPELNEQLQIRPDGRISLAFLGDVELAGKTVEEAREHLEELYAKHLKSPRIWIHVRVFAAQKIYVTGEVVRPGMQPLYGEVSVLDAISEAGGIKHTGNKKSILLVRKGEGGQPEVHKLTLLVGGKPAPEAGLLLRPFDLLMVPESRVARVDRWVDQHIRQISPAILSIGFSYLANVKSNPPPIVPF